MSKTHAIASLVLCFAVSHCSEKAKPDPHVKKALPHVVVKPVVQESVPFNLEYVGNVKALESAAIKARVPGYIIDFHFREGEDVTDRQLLFTIDPRPFEAILEKAKAKLAEDLAELKYANEQVVRYAGLASNEYLSKDAYDRYGATAAALKAAVKKDRAAIRLAAINLGYCSIKSPFAGRAGRRLVDPGNLVTAEGGPADPTLVVINQIDPIKVIFAVPEQDLMRIRNAKDLTLSVVIPGEKLAPFPGKLWLIDNLVDTGSGMIEMEGMLPNPKRILWPGQFVRVRLQVATLPDVTLVPSTAISKGQVGSYVFTVGKDGTVKKQPIKTGGIIENRTIVHDGLTAGQQVVVEGKIGLQSGAQVKVRQ
jgi:membrane fusion protein, multidrug efflux system